MKIIFKENYDFYRVVVGKLAFLSMYDDFKLVENIDYSNLMLLEDWHNNKFYASIFGQPNVKDLGKFPIRIYYQRKSFKANRDKAIKKYEKMPNDVEVLALPKEFDYIYEDYFRKAILSPEELLGVIDEKYLTMIDKYYIDSENLFVKNADYLENQTDLTELRKYFYNEEKRFLLYKYISEATVKNYNKNYNHSVNDGDLSFSHPDKFNDPFDCNCLLSYGGDLMNRFRVLCMTPIYNNILMWSHYACEHKGYCYGYSFYDILNKIERLDTRGLCLIGFVNYKGTRPKQNSKLAKFSYSDLKFYINATFTKFIDWQYEKEFRFVLIVDKDNIDNAYRDVKDEDIPKDSQVASYITINCDILERYNGVKGDGHDIMTKNGPKKVTKLIKDKQKYLIYK